MILFIASCNSKEESSNKKEELVIDKDVSVQVPLIDEGEMENIIKNLTNPIEMAALVKSVGTPFSLGYLTKPEKFEDLTLDFDKSLSLGFLSADLGYLNIYERTSSIVTYITVIKRLADDLMIGQFFDFQTLKRLATNNEDLDRLMYESVASFNQMDDHLREHGRSNLSSLIVAGVWLEGLYLGTQVYKESKNEEIGERIGEQKIVLNDLLLILKNYKADKNFQWLIKYFEKIKKEFAGVQITYRVGEPVAIEEDGKLIIKQQEESIVDITEEQLTNIVKVVEEIRNEIINR